LWLDRGELDERAASPYHFDDISSARLALLELEGQSASPSVLESIAPSVAERRDTTAVLRRRDLLDLFDTAPDLSGTDVDVAPYIRPDDERSVSVFFRALGQLGAAQIERQSAPGRDELVAVPIAAVKDLRAWSFDIVETCWRRLGRNERARPGATLMLDAADGCYSAAIGWTGRAADAVTPLPAPDVEPDGFRSDSGSYAREAVTLEDHLTQTMAAARELVVSLELDQSLAAPVVRAAALHDVGKAHAAFQEMLRSAAPAPERDALLGTLWAKSAYRGGRHVRPHFRHELASALALHDGARPVGDLRGGVVAPAVGAEDDLVRYLVAAHHGRVRLSIRPAPEEQVPHDARPGSRFALGVAEGDVLPAQRTPVGALAERVLELAEMELGGGGERSWVTVACGLRDAHGPFLLAYLEALVRISDWRASD
jgi:CRISPR-associated endonuclease/helicase Cas3